MSFHVALERPQPASSSRLALVTTISTVILATYGCVAQAENQNTFDPPPIDEYARALKTGLFTVGPDETVTVLITDLATTESSAWVTVRFFDRYSNLLEEFEDEVSPEQPLITEYTNSQGNQQGTPIRLEIELQNQSLESKPVTTVEVHRPGSFEVVERLICAGLPAREPVETEVFCPGFVVFPNFTP